MTYFRAEILGRLKVPFRRDLGAFRQEVAKAIGRHVIKDASDITKVDDWILKREENEQRLKAIHTDLLNSPRKNPTSLSSAPDIPFLGALTPWSPKWKS
jgi:hypothetical protein